MIVLMIGTSIYYLAQHIGGLSAGIELAPTLPFARIAPTWWLAGLYYTTCTPLQSAPFFTATATNFKKIKELVYGAIVGVIFYAAADIVMCCALFSNIEEMSGLMIPNQYLANSISPILGFIFVIVICSMLLPFDQLLGLVYGVYGVLGGIFVLFIIAKQVKERRVNE